MDYKKILEGVVNIINTTEKSDIGFANICTYIGENCPELTKSEDERIKKEIIEYIKTGTYHKSWISWLEKQGDKDKLIQELGEYKVKYTQEVLEKHLKTINKDDERLRKTTIAFLKDFAEQGYENAIECIDWLEKQGERPINKVEPKFKVGDKVVIDGQVCSIKIVNEDNYIVNKDGRDVQIHFSYTKDWKLVEQKNSSWSEDDEKKLNYLIALLQNSTMTNAALSATNEGIEDFLKSLKDRVQPQPKQEWSEKDEKMLKEIISDVKFEGYNNDLQANSYKKINWLKSLRPQNTWKPSEEMLEALYKVIPKNVMAISEDEMLLDKLYQGLKYGRVLSKN